MSFMNDIKNDKPLELGTYLRVLQEDHVSVR